MNLEALAAIAVVFLGVGMVWEVGKVCHDYQRKLQAIRRQRYAQPTTEPMPAYDELRAKLDKLGWRK